MRILLLEPYDTGSHAVWMRGYQAHSQHDVTILSLPGSYWKWRMQGGAVTLARLYMEGDYRPDVIVASDMLNVATFRALTRQRTSHIPVALYFHENQLTYPMGPRQRKEIHFQLALINYVSALAADAVYFNSRFHLEAFFEELPNVLKHYPDYNELDSVALLRQRSRVMPLGLDLLRYDEYRPTARVPGQPPLILWNHRWEFDKNPRAFLNALRKLCDDGIAFRVAITGENFRQHPVEFEAALHYLGDRVVQYGYVEDFAAYARLLWEADVQISTAYHDFFGISTCEAIYCGCTALLPNRLNYPDLIPSVFHKQFLYQEGGLRNALQAWLRQPKAPPSELRAHVAQFDWHVQAPYYDQIFAELARND